MPPTSTTTIPDFSASIALSTSIQLPEATDSDGSDSDIVSISSDSLFCVVVDQASSSETEMERKGEDDYNEVSDGDEEADMEIDDDDESEITNVLLLLDEFPFVPVSYIIHLLRDAHLSFAAAHLRLAISENCDWLADEQPRPYRRLFKPRNLPPFDTTTHVWHQAAIGDKLVRELIEARARAGRIIDKILGAREGMFGVGPA